MNSGNVSNNRSQGGGSTAQRHRQVAGANGVELMETSVSQANTRSKVKLPGSLGSQSPYETTGGLLDRG
ncbi:hypothetical protein EYF80_061346 [Liparis tanakae]|uniref:Uncharacterized protein n=1 Tax=Liparis tanakae TaxID=230148 RepID=A0A4Z2EHT1_9TELE|nr:hypothetical protein EYF80_061346 [Liparis tanakae]